MKLINGWTKAKVLEQIKKYNNDSKATGLNGCTYKTTDGNRCFVGCFIPDGHPALGNEMGPVYEGAANTLLKKYPDLANVMPFSGNDLMEFQSVHDCTNSTNSLISKSTYESAADFLNNELVIKPGMLKSKN